MDSYLHVLIAYPHTTIIPLCSCMHSIAKIGRHVETSVRVLSIFRSCRYSWILTGPRRQQSNLLVYCHRKLINQQARYTKRRRFFNPHSPFESSSKSPPTSPIPPPIIKHSRLFSNPPSKTNQSLPHLRSVARPDEPSAQKVEMSSRYLF